MMTADERADDDREPFRNRREEAAWNDGYRAGQAAASVPRDDPMDWPLPCDVKVGHGTIGKGCSLRTLVKRMDVLYEMAVTRQHDQSPNIIAQIYDAAPAVAQEEKP